MTPTDAPKRPSKRQRVRQIFLDAVAALAQSDGEVDANELHSIDGGLRRIGLVRRSETFGDYVRNRTVDIEHVPVEELAFPWESERLLTVMWSVALADGAYLACENALIEQVAARMNVAPARVAELRVLVCGDAKVEGLEEDEDAGETDGADTPFEFAHEDPYLMGPEEERASNATRQGTGHASSGRDASHGEVTRRFFRWKRTPAP